MERLMLVENIQQKIATIKSEESLEELQKIIDTLVTAEQEEFSWDALPDYIKLSIKNAEKNLDEGKGISHDLMMKEVRTRFPKS